MYTLYYTTAILSGWAGSWDNLSKIICSCVCFMLLNPFICKFFLCSIAKPSGFVLLSKDRRTEAFARNYLLLLPSYLIRVFSRVFLSPFFFLIPLLSSSFYLFLLLFFFSILSSSLLLFFLYSVLSPSVGSFFFLCYLPFLFYSPTLLSACFLFLHIFSHLFLFPCFHFLLLLLSCSSPSFFLFLFQLFFLIRFLLWSFLLCLLFFFPLLSSSSSDFISDSTSSVVFCYFFISGVFSLSWLCQYLNGSWTHEIRLTSRVLYSFCSRSSLFAVVQCLVSR